jgi:hypothetical protein
MEWTHAICSDCWQRRKPKGEAPIKVRNAPIEQCCFCGQPTSMGIYVRHDPRELNCKH